MRDSRRLGALLALALAACGPEDPSAMEDLVSIGYSMDGAKRTESSLNTAKRRSSMPSTRSTST